MISYLSSLIGHVSVTEEKNVIKISGIDARAFIRDIDNNWKTTRFTKNAISGATTSWITFRRFYAIEFLFIIEELMKTRGTRTPRRSLVRMRDELIKTPFLRRIVEKERLPSIMDMSRLNELTVDLFDYQKGFIELFNELVPRYGLKGYILGDKPGTGKTITSLATGHASRCKTVITIGPMNSITSVWESTIKSLYKTPRKYYTTISETNRDLVPGLDNYVFHYEALEQALDFVNQNRAALGEIFLIVDESHHFNETVRKFSNRTRALIALSKHAKFVLPMSGTVFRALGNEIIPIFIMIDPLFDASTEERFRGIYGASANRAKDILAHRVGLVVRVVEKQVKEPEHLAFKAVVPHAKRYTLSTISDGMRAYITERMAFYKKHREDYTTRYFQLVERARVKGRIPDDKLKPYLRLTKEFHDAYDPILHRGKPAEANSFEEAYILPNLSGPEKHEFRDVRSVYKYVWLKVQGEALGSILGRARAESATALGCFTGEFTNAIDESEKMTIREMIDTSNSKTVMFTSYIETIKAMAEEYTKQGYQPVVIYGDNSKELTALVKRFEDDPRANPMITTFQTLSTAVPLTMASTTIYVNQPFRDQVKQQASARTSRIGQIHDTRIIDLTMDTGAEPNISTRTKDILEWSRTEVEALMSRTRVELAMEGLRIPNIDKSSQMASDEFLDLVLEDSGLLEPINEEDSIVTGTQPVETGLINLFDW